MPDVSRSKGTVRIVYGTRGGTLGNLEQPGLHSQYGNFRTALYAKLAHDPAQTIANGRLRLVEPERNLLVRLALGYLLDEMTFF